MQAGRLRNKITLQLRTLTANAVNEEVIGYVDFVDVWAAVEPVAPKRSGGESYAAAQIQASGYTQIRIRYRPDVDPTMRIKYIARHDSPQLVYNYDIENITHTNEMRRETVFLCRQRYADGFRSG
jgi:SPP1 family predicted phage head-tail adaptor